MLIAFIIFIVLALLITGIYAFLNEPDEGWMLDPLPGLAEKGEREPDTETNAETNNHLDLEI